MVALGITFAEAFCEHFGIDNKNVAADMTLNAGYDEVLHVRPTIFVSSKDLEAIAILMQRRENPMVQS